MVAPAQVIQGLPPLSWRGMDWEHIESAPVHFSHGQAERKYPYIDGAGHDHTGMDPLKVSVRFFFLETLEDGAFRIQWPIWRKAFFDGSAGPFKHPVLGNFRARVEDGDIQFAAQTTAGIIVDVRFTSTVDNVDKPQAFRDPRPSGVQVAKAAEVAASKFGVKWPKDKLDPTMEDAFNSLLSQKWGSQTSLAAYANQLAGDVEEMIRQVEALSDPLAWAAYDPLVQAWVIATETAEQLAKDLRATGKKITQNDTTLATFAAEVGNTEEEVMQLNLALLRFPLVPSGTAVTYYTGK